MRARSSEKVNANGPRPTAQIGQNEACLVYLSSNDVTATYKATPEERLQNCHFACLQKKAEYERQGWKLVPGSEDWKTHVVNPIVGVNDPNRRGWDKLFTSARAFQFLTTGFKFTFFGDGKTTKLQELRDRLVRPRVEAKHIEKARRHEVVGGVSGEHAKPLGGVANERARRRCGLRSSRCSWRTCSTSRARPTGR